MSAAPPGFAPQEAHELRPRRLAITGNRAQVQAVRLRHLGFRTQDALHDNEAPSHTASRGRVLAGPRGISSARTGLDPSACRRLCPLSQGQALLRRPREQPDRHNGSWDRFSVYLTSGGVDIKEIESLLLRIANPSGNRVGGRLSKSEDLRSLLNRKMTELDNDRRARFMGGHVAQRRIRQKTRRGTGTLMLAGLFERRTPLRGEYQGKRYRASLRRDGHISYGGKLYESPQAAARAALGRVKRGWTFWRYRDENGDWVRLRVLKR